jgi:Cullin family
VVLTETDTKYFEDYYQLLLARRLIKFPYSEGVSGGRDCSPRSDRTMLLALPPMSLAAAMITDIEQTASTMSDFRHHLLVRIDSEELAYPSSSILSLTIKPGALNVHILSASSWPKGLISALPYAALKLPASLSFVAGEFETFFRASSASNAKKNSKFPFSSSSTGLSSKGSRGAVRIHWCHSVGSVTLSCRINQKPARHSPAHGPGSIAPPSPAVTIILSTPEAAVMMAFQSYLLTPGSSDFARQEKIQRSITELSKTTGLWNEELQEVLSSLCDPALPLLVPVDESGVLFTLSEHLLSGSLGGLREEEPLVLNGWILNPAPKHPSGLGSGLTQSWRESMVDACIIRNLKRVGREKSEVFFDSAGRTLRGTMPFDRLCGAVKQALEKKNRLVIVPSEEIRMRCNRLVSQGCIDVTRGLCTSSNSPQLVGYSYLPDLPDLKMKDATAGEILFTKLCEVLVPSDDGVECSGARVSIDQFCSAFSSWIAKSPLESRSGSLDLDNAQRDPVATFPDTAALSPLYSSSKDKDNDYSKPTGHIEEGGDRSGEHKDSHNTHPIHRTAAALYDASGCTSSSSTGPSRERNKPLVYVQRKLLLALSASIEQLRRLKTQQLEIFGLSRHVNVHAPPCYRTLLSAESRQLQIRQRSKEIQSSSDWDDFLDVNRTIFESLHSGTIQIVLEAFKTLQIISDTPPKNTKTDVADTALDNLITNLDSLDPGLDSVAYPILGLSESSSKDNFSEFFGSVEGKSPDRSTSPFVSRKCDAALRMVAGGVGSVEGSDAEGVFVAAVAERIDDKRERTSREDLLESIGTLWSRPVPINLIQIQGILKSIGSEPDTSYPRNTDRAYSAAHTAQQRGRPSAAFLREIMRTCSAARPLNGADGEISSNYLALPNLVSSRECSFHFFSST